MYVEAGPVIETPLSAAASLHDMLLTSWGDAIRVFPAVPDAWPDVCFHKLRAQGAFLVSARREAGKTRFIYIESLAGEPCRLITDMPDPAAHGVNVKKLGSGEYEIALKKGQAVLLTPDGADETCSITPVADQQDKEHFYGLH
jgi:hypothetical protein